MLGLHRRGEHDQHLRSDDGKSPLRREHTRLKLVCQPGGIIRALKRVAVSYQRDKLSAAFQNRLRRAPIILTSHCTRPSHIRSRPKLAAHARPSIAPSVRRVFLNGCRHGVRGKSTRFSRTCRTNGTLARTMCAHSGATSMPEATCRGGAGTTPGQCLANAAPSAWRCQPATARHRRSRLLLAAPNPLAAYQNGG